MVKSAKCHIHKNCSLFTAIEESNVAVNAVPAGRGLGLYTITRKITSFLLYYTLLHCNMNREIAKCIQYDPKLELPRMTVKWQTCAQIRGKGAPV